MAATRITREQMIEQSLIDLVREGLFTVREYPEDRVELMDAFDPEAFDALPSLDRSYVTLGFNFDRGGVPIELGSTLVERRHETEVWVLGEGPVEARNLAYAVRGIIEEAGSVPLKDYADPATPVIDSLIVEPVSADHQPIADPKPWQRYVWVVRAPLIDHVYLREG